MEGEVKREPTHPPQTSLTTVSRPLSWGLLGDGSSGGSRGAEGVTWRQRRWTCAFTSGQQEALCRLHAAGTGKARSDSAGQTLGTSVSRNPVLDPPPSNPESRSLRPRFQALAPLHQSPGSRPKPSSIHPGNNGSWSCLTLLTGSSSHCAASR